MDEDIKDTYALTVAMEPHGVVAMRHGTWEELRAHVPMMPANEQWQGWDIDGTSHDGYAFQLTVTRL